MKVYEVSDSNFQREAFRDDHETVPRLIHGINALKEEADDAQRVLSSSVSGPLHPTQQAQIATAIGFMNQALAATDPAVRRDRTNDARNLLTTVKNALGTGMNFQLGAGNLMF